MKIILQTNLKTVRDTGRTTFEFDSTKHSLFIGFNDKFSIIEVCEPHTNNTLFATTPADASVWADNCRAIGQYLAAGCTRFPG